MKVARYYGKGHIRIEEMSIPPIKDDEVLLEMRACGICGSDLMEWYLDSRVPLVLGHEPTGVITRKGKKVTDFNIDDRIFVHHHVACLTCHYCLRGDYTLCTKFHETNIEPGGFSEFIRIPALNLQVDTLNLPDTLSFEEATLIEPIGCCLRALKKCGIHPGDSMAIIGVGVTGILHVTLSKIFGVVKTIAADVVVSRLDVAKKFGADITVCSRNESVSTVAKAETDGHGVDIVIVTAPSVQAYIEGINSLRKGGKLCVFAPSEPNKYLQISPQNLFFSEFHLIPSYSTSHLETRTALKLLNAKYIDVQELITHRFKLMDIEQAFTTAKEKKESLKIIIYN